jgi:3-oxoadipate enol-lactonase
MQINANGINIHYKIEGPANAPWLMFSNSLLTNLTMWDEQAEHFSKDYRVLRYDQRGHGRSEAPQGPYPFDVLIADALALMNALNIERTHFCGLSLGGATAKALALRRPDRVDHVIVCDSPCASSTVSAQQWAERITVAKEQGIAALLESTLNRWFHPETIAANPPYLQRIREMILTTPVDGFMGCAAALSDHDFRPGVPTTKSPVLFLAGEKDGVVPEAMRKLQSALPGSIFVELPGAGHISNLDQPALFNSAVEGFLRT